MTKKIIFAGLGVLAVVVIVFGVNYFSSGSALGAAGIGPNHTSAENFLQGLYGGTLGQLKISNSGALTIGTGGTAVSKFLCASATWNPGSVASSGAALGTYVTSTDIALPGAVMGDECGGSLTSATSSGLSVDCTVTNAATATIALYNISGAAIDPATGTAKVCFTH